MNQKEMNQKEMEGLIMSIRGCHAATVRVLESAAEMYEYRRAIPASSPVHPSSFIPYPFRFILHPFLVSFGEMK
jgi:hypothetical protein